MSAEVGADVLMAQAAIDVQPPADHGKLQDEPFMSQGPAGAPEVAADASTDADVPVEACCMCPAIECAAWVVAPSAVVAFASA